MVNNNKIIISNRVINNNKIVIIINNYNNCLIKVLINNKMVIKIINRIIMIYSNY